MARRYLEEAALTAGQQDLLLRKVWPGFSVEWDCEAPSWRGWLQPSPVSQSYHVRIDYRLGQRPAVHVLNPTLEEREGESVPHLYPDRSLCLFKPKRREWGRHMPIADTIVPWTSLWLLHYENWLLTGLWEGGGEHPDKGRGNAKRLARLGRRDRRSGRKGDNR